ncbi:MAG: ATP-dependent DNA helicase [Rhodospirillales bacterium]|nr:ATP-dependent DNA helicase [Rhodospirillales bacterium]
MHSPSPLRIALPTAPALVAGVRGAAWLSPDGAIESLSREDAAGRIQLGKVPFVCHAKATARKLGIQPFATLDLLELFAFVRPARFCIPTPRGIADALGLPLPRTMEDEAESLVRAATALLSELPNGDPQAGQIAGAMSLGGWSWGPAVLAACGAGVPHSSVPSSEALKIWLRLPTWDETAPETAPMNAPVTEMEARRRLTELLGGRAERRPQQADYAAGVSAAFRPRDREDEPRLVLAEAGTGVGKTIGYIAPASVWAEKNEAPVWISTFTRNLQRQLDAELDRLYPDAAEKAEKVVVRKGRENYLCLLNFEEAVGRVRTAPEGRGGRGIKISADAVALGLMARWALATRDGDMAGGDFPAWLADLLGRGQTLDLTDTRGECIYSACAHYGRCFIERSVRKARQARIVVANHALVLVHAARGGEGQAVPTRYVFDEGHHLFGAADSAFAAHLTVRETADLRRWIVGAEEGSRSRARGLKMRVADLFAGDEAMLGVVGDAVTAAQALPGPGWTQRLAGGNPAGAAEAFFAGVREQIYARDPEAGAPYDLETETTDLVLLLPEAALALDEALARLSQPLIRLAAALATLLDAKAAELDTPARNRIEAVRRGLERRTQDQVLAWRAMLKALFEATPPEFVDWFGIERSGGRDFDVGLYRHWIDPTIPLAEAVLRPAHGALITSATLKDRPADSAAGATEDWLAARARTGAAHVASVPDLVEVPSPFDYVGCTRVLIVRDIDKDNRDQVAAAFRELFLASRGGALGLFTAIARLRDVYERIAGPLEDAGISILAQHVDALDTGTLVDIFRAEEDACLLGTDAVRDGVDVPGRSLRLIVFDRVPWPRPDILHRARRKAFGGRIYEEMLTRLKLKQAYGRLIRRADDKGVFVMLDRALPSRLLGAFPEGVEVKRIGLKEAISETRAFLHEGGPGR